MSNNQQERKLYVPNDSKYVSSYHEKIDSLKIELEQLKQTIANNHAYNEQKISSEQVEIIKKLDEKIDTSEKYLKEYINSQNNIESKTLFRWFLGLLPTIILAIFAIGAFNTFDLNREKAELEKFKEDIRNELLGVTLKEAKLELLGRNQKSLKNQTIDVEFIEEFNKTPSGQELKEPVYRYGFTIFVKNTGEGFIDPKKSFFVVYGNSKRFPQNDCIDDVNYNECDIINIQENEVLTKINKKRITSYQLSSRTKEIPQRGMTEKIKVKIIYGDSEEEEVSSEFYIRFSEKLQSKKVYK